MNMNKKILFLLIFILLISPSYKVDAASEKKITVYCYCKYDENKNITCPDDCKPDAVEEAIKEECGGRKSEITGEVKYYCNRQDVLWIPIKDSERIGSSPEVACQNFYNNEQDKITDSSGSLKVTVKATCNPVKDVLGEYICEEKDVLKALSFLGYFLLFAKLLIPFIIILMGTFDYYKAVTAAKNDELSKQTKTFIRRIFLGIVVFFVPSILNTFMSIISDQSEVVSMYEKCVSCALDPISCDKE